MSTITAAHLPDGVAAERAHVLEASGFRVEFPAVEPDVLRRVCGDLTAAGEALRRAPLPRVISAIDAAAANIDERVDELAPAVAAFTRTSVPMARTVIRRMTQDWRAPSLRALLAAEFPDPDVLQPLDATRSRIDSGGMVRAVPPRLALHVFSGNVPGVSVTSLVRALLVRSPVLGKVAAGEPVLASMFARAFAQADPDLGRAIAVTYWPGGEEATESAVLPLVDQVVHYGSGAAVSALRARVPAGVQFVEHGPKVSLALIGPRADVTRIADDAALAMSVFDQQGCVSPQEVYVLGDTQRARDVAASIAAALDRLRQELPAGPLDAADAAAVRAFRTRAEFADPVHTQLWEGKELSWTVVCTDLQDFPGSCLNRTIVVRAAANVQAMADAVVRLGAALQTVGLDGFAPEDAAALVQRLALAGATRFCPIASMPWPPVTWHHDGRGPLRELVRWVDVER